MGDLEIIASSAETSPTSKTQTYSEELLLPCRKQGSECGMGINDVIICNNWMVRVGSSTCVQPLRSRLIPRQRIWNLVLSPYGCSLARKKERIDLCLTLFFSEMSNCA